MTPATNAGKKSKNNGSNFKMVQGIHVRDA